MGDFLVAVGMEKLEFWDFAVVHEGKRMLHIEKRKLDNQNFTRICFSACASIVKRNDEFLFMVGVK